MRTFPQRAVEGPVSRLRILTWASPEFSTGTFLALRPGGSTSGTWVSANKPVAIPFRISTGITVRQLGWRNGSGTMTDSFDIGIYDTSWNRKIAGGGTARSGASNIQWVNVTDTDIPPGSYYLVGANNGTTANNYARSAGFSTNTMRLLGVQDSSTNAYPLPDPLTNMVAAATFPEVPMMLIACVVPFS